MYRKDLLWLSVKNVLRAGVRTLLCVLAICIGIASVSTVSELGNAAANSIQQEMDRIGISGVVFYPKNGEQISEAALEAIAQADGVSAAMPLSLKTGTIHLRSLRSTAGILGIDDQLPNVFHLEVLHGNLPQKHQVSANEKIAVIDADLAKKVYKRSNIVGKTISVTINGVTETMTICAVIQSQSASLSALLGNQLPYLVYIPYTTLNQMSTASKVDKVVAAVEGADQNELAKTIQSQLVKATGENYQFENLNHYLQSFTSIASALTLLISGIAIISVVVGGIGVMNAMISSVDVRIREIGIYRALGAKKSDIVQTFLFEAIFLCLIGGAAGILFSWGIFQILNFWIPFSFQFHWKSVWGSLGISAFCGIVFGLLPALRASSLDPIQAIRME